MAVKLKPGQHGEIFISEHKDKYRAKVRACLFDGSETQVSRVGPTGEEARLRVQDAVAERLGAAQGSVDLKPDSRVGTDCRQWINELRVRSRWANPKIRPQTVDEYERLLGNHVVSTLARVVGQRQLLDADDPCAVVLTRLACDNRQRVRPSRRSTQLIAGMVPPALGPMSNDARRALDERAQLIGKRAAALARSAIRNRAAWVGRIGAEPLDGPGREAWGRAVAMVAACRDRYRISGPAPLGPPSDDPRQARDRDAAQAAMRGLKQSGPRGSSHSAPSSSVGL